VAQRSAALYRLTRQHEKAKAPVLVIAAGMDRVVSNDAIMHLVRRVPGITLVTIPGGTPRNPYRMRCRAAAIPGSLRRVRDE
jgi:alpha-beta hydrolase superfamily lysophospholipase